MQQGFSCMDTTKGRKAGKVAQIRSATLSLKIWPELKDALDLAAVEDGRSTSQYVERALIAHLQDIGKWPK